MGQFLKQSDTRERDFAIHLKAREDEALLFWLTFLPDRPGHTVWAEVTWAENRGRLGAVWPPGLGIPFGVDGDGLRSCFSVMVGAREAAARIAAGDGSWRLANSPHLDEIARSRWGASDHVRACFRVDLRGQVDERTELLIRILDGKQVLVDRTIAIGDI